MTTEQTDDAIKQIIAAFENVTLGVGTSLREADVIDDFGTDVDRAVARKRDELNDWQRISDEDIENFEYAMCFMDELGLRFHLPAYMCFTLRRYQHCKSISTDATIYRLCDSACIKKMLALLTKQQIASIHTFLTTCLMIGKDWLDVSYIPFILSQWQIS